MKAAPLVTKVAALVDTPGLALPHRCGALATALLSHAHIQTRGGVRVCRGVRELRPGRGAALAAAREKKGHRDMKIVVVALVAFGGFAVARFPAVDGVPTRPHSATIRAVGDPSWQDAGALVVLASGLFAAAIRLKQRTPPESAPGTTEPARG